MAETQSRELGIGLAYSLVIHRIHRLAAKSRHAEGECEFTKRDRLFETWRLCSTNGAKTRSRSARMLEGRGLTNSVLTSRSK